MTFAKKKKSFLVTMMVCASALLFCSLTWAEDIECEGTRIYSFMQHQYSIGFILPPDAYQAAKDYLNTLYDTTGWTVFGIGFLSLSDRSNFRGCNGEVVGTGEQLSASLLLLVNENPGDPNTVILLKTFGTSQENIDYSIGLGFSPPGTQAVEINYKHKVDRADGITHIKTKYEVMDTDGEKVIKFKAHWEKGSPSFFPPGPNNDPPPDLGPVNLVATVNLNFRNSNDLYNRILQFGRNDTSYPLKEGDIPQIKFNLSDPDLGAIFNDVTKENLFFGACSFVKRLQTYDDITPP